MDMAVLGNESFVIGFKLGGVKRSYPSKPENYENKILELIADPTIGVLAVSSDDVEKLSPDDPAQGDVKHRPGGRRGGKV